jgi:hypothetical protein
MQDRMCTNVREYMTMMRYLMSIIIFGHFQRPSVASKLKVKEFLVAKKATDGRTIVLVSDHKTKSKGPAPIALEEADYKLFYLFLKRFRPSKCKSEYFFVRLGNGKPITNATNETDILQKEFGLISICSGNARHVLETAKGNAGLDASTSAGISKYLCHSEPVASQYYDFSLIEQSARNRAAILNLIGGQPSTVDVETTSNSTIDDTEENMTGKQRTDRLYELLRKDRPLSIHGKVPFKEDANAVIAHHFKCDGDFWSKTAAKNVSHTNIICFIHFVLIFYFTCVISESVYKICT